MPVSPTDELEDQSNVANLNDSNDEGLDGQAGDQNSDDSNSADTSTAGDAEKPSLLDAISSALKPEGEKSSGSGDDEEAKAAAAAATGKTEDKPAGAEEEDLGEITDEELKGYHSKTRRRVKQLIGKAKEYEGEIKTLKPVAERMAKIDQFVEANGLSKENMNTLFGGAVKLKQSGVTDDDFKASVEVMVAIRNDPNRAYELLLPLVESLAVITGDVLSPELIEQVNAGQITEEAAREISRHRAGRVITTTQQTEAEKRTQTEAQQRAQTQLAQQGDAVATGITNWESAWKSRDPDYAIKSSLWRDKMDAYVAKVQMKQEPAPADAKAIVAIAEKFKKDVEATLLKLRPSRKPITPTPHGVGTSTGSKAAPASLKEAISTALVQQ